jgi:thiol:disulfide interchange protein DsbD
MILKRLSLIVLLFALFSNLALAQLLPRPASSLATQSQSTPQPLSLEQAFPFYVSEVSPGRLRIDWILADGHYLYQHAFKFSMTGPLKSDQDAAAVPVNFTLPAGLTKTDQFFGDIVAYYGKVSVEISLTTVPGPDSALIIEYQGCADWGFCYPPQRAEHRLVP